MAGIYIHIPFCKQKCHYCDFHFSISMKNKDEILNCLKKEFYIRKTYLGDINENIETIYFGGGTPSILEADEISELIEYMSQHYNLDNVKEITLECNPDDINLIKIKALATTKVNRLSIGIQSFNNDDLISLNRAHSAQEAIDSVKMAQDAGLDNITIDLIYGLPNSTIETWQKNLDLAEQLSISHLSAYALTIEKRTALHHFIQKGIVKVPDDEMTLLQFEQLMNWAEAQNMIHYEISNFANDGHIAIHNTNYWKDKKYIGFGPSAHSYNGLNRTWNIANNSRYIKAINNGELDDEIETLTIADKYNEYVLTSLRTIWGIDTIKIENFGREIHFHFMANIQAYINSGHIIISNKGWSLTRLGKYMADRISSDLFWVND